MSYKRNCISQHCMVLAVTALGLTAAPNLARSQTAVSTHSAAATQPYKIDSSAEFRRALETAWAKQPQSTGQKFRANEIDARRRIALSRFAGPVNLTFSHTTDLLTGNSGVRGYDIEISAPLWNSRTQSANLNTIDREEIAVREESKATKSHLALDLVNLIADYEQSKTEETLLDEKLRESALFIKDLERRLKVGEIARLELLQAQQARIQLLKQSELASLNVARSETLWGSVTGLKALAPLPNSIKPGGLVSTQAEYTEINESALLTAAKAQLELASAKLKLVQIERKDPIEVGLGFTRDRSAVGGSSDSTLKFSIRIPLTNNNQTVARLAAAQLEEVHAQTELAKQEQSIRQDVLASQLTLMQAERGYQNAKEQLEIVNQMYVLLTRAYQLGERDLQSVLRATAEKFEAELNTKKAEIEINRAATTLQIKLGKFPL
jgi:outer membrane protein, heavy metal efflux system